jgi:RNA polymerase sigma-70 factor (ECF subfamily)
MTRYDATDRELVEQARGGDPQKLDALARLVQERVYPYLRRVTLDEHKAEDLTQETVFAVLKSLTGFGQAERFWPWVFTIATNFVRQHFRVQSRHRTVSMSRVEESHISGCGGDDGLTETSRRELAELTRQAMDCVGERYRMVLALRFYEDMPHTEVARVMGCTEFNARALFFRAKHALVRELKRLGIGRTALVAALVAFGKMTLHPASASAAAATVSVSSAAVAEGVIAGLLTAKAKVAVAAVLLLSAVGTWFVWHEGIAGGSGRLPAASGPPSAMVTAPGIPQTAEMPRPADTSPLYVHTICHGRSLAAINGIRELFEIWWYFPQGVNGPHMVRRVPVNEADRTVVNWGVETAEMNYAYYHGRNEIHIENARSFCPQLHVEILPTDSAVFCAFVAAMDGQGSHATVDKQGFTVQRDSGTGFVIGQTDTRPKMGAPYASTVEYNPPTQIDPFAYAPPADIELADDRDPMHKRGWTYFHVTGQFAGEAVTGAGQIPFTYAASLTNPAWLRLRIAERFIVSDDGRQALVRDSAGAVRLTFAGGSFLKGMSRPWEGFHTLNTVRRDAAGVRCRYTAAPAEEYVWMIVRVFQNADSTAGAGSGGGAEYRIDTAADLLGSVRYWQEAESAPVCELQFSYLDSVEGVGEEFEAPGTGTPGAGEVIPGGTPLWPLELLSRLSLQQAR